MTVGGGDETGLAGQAAGGGRVGARAALQPTVAVCVRRPPSEARRAVEAVSSVGTHAGSKEKILGKCWNKDAEPQD